MPGGSDASAGWLPGSGSPDLTDGSAHRFPRPSPWRPSCRSSSSTGLLKTLVPLVQQEVRKQGRQRPALWSPLGSLHHRALPHEPRQSLVVDRDGRPSGQAAHQHVMVDPQSPPDLPPPRPVSFRASPCFADSPRGRWPSIRFLFVRAAFRLRLPFRPRLATGTLALGYTVRCYLRVRWRLSLQTTGHAWHTKGPTSPNSGCGPASKLAATYSPTG